MFLVKNRVGNHAKPAQKMWKTADDVILGLGDLQRFQIAQLVILSLQVMPCVMCDLAAVFYLLEPLGLYFSDAVNMTKFDDVRSASDCLELRNMTVDRFVFVEPQWSVIGDMSLFCERFWLASFSTTCYFLGTIASGPLFGWAADKFGRRPMLILANICFVAFQTGLIFSRDIASFCLLRFLVGAMRQGIHTTSAVLLMEWTTAKRRHTVSAMMQFPLSFGILYLALMAWLFETWHHMQIAITLSSVSAIGLYWFAPESIRWLLAHQRVNDTARICKKVAAFNKNVQLPGDLLMELQNVADTIQKTSPKSGTMIECFRTPYIRAYSVLTGFLSFSMLFVYMGLSLLMTSLSGNIYTNFAIGVSLELIPRILSVIASFSKAKNRPGLAISFIFTALFCLLAGVIPEESETAAKAIVAMALLARMSLIGAWTFVTSYPAELFPTPIRNNGINWAYACARVGAVLAPQLVMFAQVHRFKGLAYITLSVIAVIATLAALLLPETKGTHLPATIREAEELGQKTMLLCCKKWKSVLAGTSPSDVAGRNVSVQILGVENRAFDVTLDPVDNPRVSRAAF